LDEEGEEQAGRDDYEGNEKGEEEEDGGNVWEDEGGEENGG